MKTAFLLLFLLLFAAHTRAQQNNSTSRRPAHPHIQIGQFTSWKSPFNCAPADFSQQTSISARWKTLEGNLIECQVIRHSIHFFPMPRSCPYWFESEGAQFSGQILQLVQNAAIGQSFDIGAHVRCGSDTTTYRTETIFVRMR